MNNKNPEKTSGFIHKIFTILPNLQKFGKVVEETFIVFQREGNVVTELIHFSDFD